MKETITIIVSFILAMVVMAHLMVWMLDLKDNVYSSSIKMCPQCGAITVVKK